MKVKAPIHIPTLMACALFASKQEERYYLNGIYVEARKGGVIYCATDGIRLLTRFVEDDDVKASDFLIIPSRICKALPKPHDEAQSGTLTFGALEASICFDGITITFEPVQGTFPHFAAVVPATCSGETAQFNGLYAVDFDKAAKIIGCGSPVICHNGSGPAAIHFGAQPDMIGVLMPMKKEEIVHELPDWLGRTSGTTGAMPDYDPETGEIIEDVPVADNATATRVEEAHA